MLNDRIIVTPLIDEDEAELRKFKMAIPHEELQEFLKQPMGDSHTEGIAGNITRQLVKYIDGKLFGIGSYDKPWMEVDEVGVVSFFLKPDTDEKFNEILLERFISVISEEHFPWVKRWKMYDNKKFDALLKRGLKK